MQDGNLLPFPIEGLKLSFILIYFYELCGNRSGLNGKTTSDVNEVYQKKFTESSRVSFCEYLKRDKQHRSAVGKATVFVSHAWKYEFLEVMDALKNHFHSEPDVIIWFDVFSVNQHADVVDFEWWCTAFKSAIREFSRTVMVLAPWHDPIPLKRGWCLFELYCTIVTASSFEVAMSKASTAAFLKDITRAPIVSINRMLATINVEKSDCFKPEDKARIFALVLQEVSVSQINSMIFDRMRAWVVDCAEAARLTRPDDLDLLAAVAALYQQQGRYDLAEPLSLTCLERRRAGLGSHPLVLSAMNSLATVYKCRGSFSLAEPLFLECLEKQRERIGYWHPDTLLTMNNIAHLYFQQGEHQKAEPLYLSCLEKRRIVLGEAHPDTLESLNNSAALYDSQGRYDMAEPLYGECVATRKRKLGEAHPDTLLSMHNLAVLYRNKGDRAKAESLFRHCLEQRRTLLGEGHPDTDSTRRELQLLNHNPLSSNLPSSYRIPSDGIKLSYLLGEFQELCGGKSKLEGLTTTEFVLQFVKPMTCSSELSFVDYLKSQNHPVVGPATVFISSSWTYLFLDTLGALENLLRDEPDTILWFDVFSINQHAAVDLDVEWWLSSFKAFMKDCGRVVMVLAPWNDPIPFSRGWNVFELYCTVILNLKLQVALSQSALERFLEDISDSPIKAINGMLAAIDVSQAVCFMAEDQQRILDLIRRDIGIAQLNSMIFERMRSWIIEAAAAALAKDETNLNLMNAVASLYQQQGNYDLAEPFFLDCLEKRRAAFGDSHPVTLSSVNSLATLYRHLGRTQEAEVMYWECVEQQRHDLGDTHPDTTLTMHHVGELYCSQGKLKRAEPIVRDCLEKRRIVHGDVHPDTLASMDCLGTLYNSLGKYDLAEPLLIDCLESRLISMGKSHPDTLISMHHLALLYDNQEEYGKAEALYMDCLERRTILLSWDHPDTASTRNDLMSLYRRKQSDGPPAAVVSVGTYRRPPELR